MAYRGTFVPTNPKKWYISKSGLAGGKIEYRSLWELKFMKWADNHPSVLSVASEEVIIPYRSPVDGKVHRYYMDFYLKMTNNNGEIVEKLIEVKPNVQTKMPRKKKNLRRYIKECKTYAVNLAKWEAAKVWADDKNMEFLIMDEYSLGIRERKTK